MAPVKVPSKTVNPEAKASYKKYNKDGPELLVTRILMVNGPLTSKEIWRIYERMQTEEK
jgi:hypothetical protein